MRADYCNSSWTKRKWNQVEGWQKRQDQCLHLSRDQIEYKGKCRMILGSDFRERLYNQWQICYEYWQSQGGGQFKFTNLSHKNTNGNFSFCVCVGGEGVEMCITDCYECWKRKGKIPVFKKKKKNSWPTGVISNMRWQEIHGGLIHVTACVDIPGVNDKTINMKYLTDEEWTYNLFLH